MTLRRSLGCLTLLLTLGGPLAAQATAVEGQLGVLWIDPLQGPPPPPEFRLHTFRGEVLRLEGAPATLASLRGGERVRVEGVLTSRRRGGEPVIQVSRARSIGGADLAGPAPTRLRYLTLLCEAPGGAPMVYTAEAARRRWGKEYPAVGHFLDEVSEGQLDYVADDVIGPVPLPQPAEYYGAFGEGDGFRLSEVTDHCLAAAGQPDLEPYDGINFHFDIISGAAFGGSFFRTGVSHTLRATWIPDYHSGFGVLAHEAGHSIGWPHSGSDYGAPDDHPYDSGWDVMSRTWLSVEQVATAFGYTGVYRQTIAVNRAAQGWLADGRWVVHPSGTEVTYRLEVPASSRNAPWAPGAVELLQVATPTGGLYALEARMQRGNYDIAIPRSGVILHRLLAAPRLGLGVFAKLVDADLDGDPSDDGAAWLPGESHALEAPGGFAFEVLEQLTNGYLVRVRSGYRLRVEVVGQGKVTGLPDGDCIAECIILSGAPASALPLSAIETDPDYPFRGWLGDCSGTGTCQGRRTRDFAVTAWFGRDVRFLADSSRPFATIGVTYRDTLRADALGAVTWSIVAGALPPGLSLNPVNGAVTGIPTVVGSHAFTVRATDGVLTTTRRFAIDVVRPLVPAPGDTVALVWFADTKVPLVNGTGSAVDVRLVDGTWPEGMRLNGTTGLLTGRPSALGTTTATWTGGPGTAPRTVHFLVLPDSILVETTRVPDTFVGFTTNFAFRTTGSSPVVWGLTGGTLPPGVTLTAAGILAGRPAVSGSFTITVEARRATLSDARTFSFLVAEPQLLREEVAGALLRGTGLAEYERSYLDFIGNRNGRVDLGDVRAWLQRRGLLPTGGGT